MLDLIVMQMSKVNREKGYCIKLRKIYLKSENGRTVGRKELFIFKIIYAILFQC